MAGSKLGGLKTRETNYEKHGRDFYKRVGRIGGLSTAANGTIKGFAAMSPERRSEVGRIGGSRSRKRASYTRDGMKSFLDATAHRHNGAVYDDWIGLYQLAAPIADLVQIFNVTDQTIFMWKRQTKLELDKDWRKRTVKV